MADETPKFSASASEIADRALASVSETPRLSASIAHLLVTRSPRHAWNASRQLNPDYEPEVKDAFDLGNVVHELVLRGRDIAVVGQFNEYRTDTAKQWRDETRAAGKIPLRPKDHERVLAMHERIREQLEAIDVDPPLLQHGSPEIPIEWEEADVSWKARLDWLRDDRRAIDDLKTTSRSADPSSYERNLYANGGDIQAALYQRAVVSLNEQQFVPPPFRWIVCETEPPYCVSVIEPGADVLALGNAKVDLAAAIWRECIASGEWPGYPPVVHTAELPPWEESRFLERMEQTV